MLKSPLTVRRPPGAMSRWPELKKGASGHCLPSHRRPASTRSVPRLCRRGPRKTTTFETFVRAREVVSGETNRKRVSLASKDVPHIIHDAREQFGGSPQLQCGPTLAPSAESLPPVDRRLLLAKGRRESAKRYARCMVQVIALEGECPLASRGQVRPSAGLGT